jgi:hypothetical protein
MGRNGNSISVDVIEDTIVTSIVSALVLDFFWHLRINTTSYIVGKYKINLHPLRNRPEKLAKGSFIYLFLKLVQINFIIANNICILKNCSFI